MRKVSEYEAHAAECRELAAKMSDPVHKKQLRGKWPKRGPCSPANGESSFLSKRTDKTYHIRMRVVDEGAA